MPTMTETVNDPVHASQTNPCQGICVSEDNYCIGCFRTKEERRNWYSYTNQQREQILNEIEQRAQEFDS
jgi:predicted Fe-S protein YdhL (DUF1289 family)